MRITLYYDFTDELYREGRDTFEVTMHNFPFDVETNNESMIDTITLRELYDGCRDKALKLAAEK